MMEAEDYMFTEMADIHFFYGRANGNVHEVRRLYQETFPNPRLPCSRTFSRIVQRLRETGVLRQWTSYVILKRVPTHELKSISRNLFTFGPMLIRTFLFKWGWGIPRKSLWHRFWDILYIIAQSSVTYYKKVVFDCAVIYIRTFYWLLNTTRMSHLKIVIPWNRILFQHKKVG
jgi:hypothetical protein